MEKVRYGIVGCGKHALQSHAIPGLKVPELELLTLCDTNPESMERFGRELLTRGAKIPVQFTDVRKMVEYPYVDAVVIATPDHLHADQALSALSCEAHVLADKPLAVNREDLRLLDESLKVARKKKLVFTSCHPRRFDDAFIELKRQLEELRELLGKALVFSFDFSYHETPEGWKNKRGLLVDHLSHEIDLMHFLFGYQDFSIIKGCDSFDRYKVSGMRDDGLAFDFHGTRLLAERRYPEILRIRFSAGTVEADLDKGVLRTIYHESGKRETQPLHCSDYPEKFRRVMQNFALSVMGKEKPYLSPFDLYVNNATAVKLANNASCRLRLKQNKTPRS